MAECCEHSTVKPVPKDAGISLIGLFDRASSSWNKVKCQLDATR